MYEMFFHVLFGHPIMFGLLTEKTKTFKTLKT